MKRRVKKIKFNIFKILSIVLIIIFISTILTYDISTHIDSALAKIDSLSCSKLKEYILNVGSKLSYAEHRYLWMCEK